MLRTPLERRQDKEIERTLQDFGTAGFGFSGRHIGL
jgi:hypothetical protein